MFYWSLFQVLSLICRFRLWNLSVQKDEPVSLLNYLSNEVGENLGIPREYALNQC